MQPAFGTDKDVAIRVSYLKETGLGTNPWRAEPTIGPLPLSMAIILSMPLLYGPADVAEQSVRAGEDYRRLPEHLDWPQHALRELRYGLDLP